MRRRTVAHPLHDPALDGPRVPPKPKDEFAVAMASMNALLPSAEEAARAIVELNRRLDVRAGLAGRPRTMEG